MVGGMAAENRWGTTLHCQINFNELTDMVYKLSKFNSITYATHFVGRTNTEAKYGVRLGKPRDYMYFLKFIKIAF